MICNEFANNEHINYHTNGPKQKLHYIKYPINVHLYSHTAWILERLPMQIALPQSTTTQTEYFVVAWNTCHQIQAPLLYTTILPKGKDSYTMYSMTNTQYERRKWNHTLIKHKSMCLNIWLYNIKCHGLDAVPVLRQWNQCLFMCGRSPHKGHHFDRWKHWMCFFWAFPDFQKLWLSWCQCANFSHRGLRLSGRSVIEEKKLVTWGIRKKCNINKIGYF
jgi:hypothetical protein